MIYRRRLSLRTLVEAVKCANIQHMAKRFITGLRMRNKTLEWTTLREDKEGIKDLMSNKVALEADDAVFADPESLSAAIKQQCPELTGPATLGIASDKLLMRVVELPAVDIDEINSMIQLQVDKLSPFPDDRMVSSYEVLKKKEDACWVLIVAIQRDLVEFIGTVFQKVGLDIQRMDVEVMGWWRLLSDQKTMLDKGRQVILLLEAEGGVIIAVQDGIPVSFKAISSGEGLSEDEYAAEIVEETGALILALDLEQGACEVSSMDIWYRDINPEALTARLKDEFAQDVHIQSLESLPPFGEGLTRRMLNPVFSTRTSSTPAHETDAVIDLFPVAWRISAAASRIKRQMIFATALVLGLWIIGIAVLMIGYHLEQRKLNKLEARINLLQEPTDEVRGLQQRVKSFEQYLDKKRSALECLREISQLLPENVELLSFQFKKGNNVLLRGEALSVNPIYDFKQALDQSTLFKAIELGSIQPSKKKAKTVQSFQMIARMPEVNP